VTYCWCKVIGGLYGLFFVPKLRGKVFGVIKERGWLHLWGLKIFDLDRNAKKVE